MDFIIEGVKKIIKSLHGDNICRKCRNTCYTIYFQRNFENWTSGNDIINKFIQDSQLLAHNDVKEALEWIPYDRLYNIKYIVEGRFYRANWVDGNIMFWDSKSQNWKRTNCNMSIILKWLNNITIEFMNKV
jgi:hypothetical protein